MKDPSDVNSTIASTTRLPGGLSKPVPNQDKPLARKQGYRGYELDTNGTRASERLVNIADYGIAGQSYYSRPNSATGRPVSDVPETVHVRQTIAEKLGAINQTVQKSELVTELFNGQVELYVDEGLRSQRVQRQLYGVVFPRLIHEQFPDMTDSEVYKRRDHMIAQPVTDPASPSPHSTGSAVDVKLRYKQDTRLFVPKAEVFMGHTNADMGNTSRPDAYEQSAASAGDAEYARRNRRIFYWVMRGVLTNEDSGFAVNPTEWWHWSYGDQMWASLTGAPAAFYGMAQGGIE